MIFNHWSQPTWYWWLTLIRFVWLLESDIHMNFSWHWLRWWRWMVENKNIHEFIGRSWEIFHRTTFTVCCKILWYLIFFWWDIWCSWNICLTFHGMCDEIFVQISACLSLHSWLHQFSSKCDVTFLPPPAPARLFWKNSSEIAKQEINWFVSRELLRAAESCCKQRAAAQYCGDTCLERSRRRLTQNWHWTQFWLKLFILIQMNISKVFLI